MKIVSFITCLFLVSCVSNNEGNVPNNKYGDLVEFSLKEVNISSSEVLQLKDYPITGFIGTDSLQSIVGYNYRTHSLDKIRLYGNPCISSLQLSKEGPNGVFPRVKSICPVSDDSIWVYDGTFISLLNNCGEICHKISFPSDVQVLLETNYAMHTGIYNYPYESTVYMLDMMTGKYSEIGAASKYTSNAASRCDSKTDYSVWQRYGLENTHFYDVMYLPDLQVYARFHIEGKSMSASEELTQGFWDSRSLYPWIMKCLV